MDPSEGRVYISRDIVFDEHVFPFARLHPNAGARLRAELSVLPDSLHNPNFSFLDSTLLDHCGKNAPTTNHVPSSHVVLDETGKSAIEHGENLSSNDADLSSGGRHFMCPLPGDRLGTQIQVDPILGCAAPTAPPESTSGSTTDATPRSPPASSGSSVPSAAASLRATPVPLPQMDRGAGRHDATASATALVQIMSGST